MTSDFAGGNLIGALAAAMLGPIAARVPVQHGAPLEFAVSGGVFAGLAKAGR